MESLDKEFRRRIGFPEQAAVTFGHLGEILEKTAKTIPFENLSILAGQTGEMTRENLMGKLIKQNKGGLCYELNALLYFFLQDNGYDVSLVQGVIYSEPDQSWSETGRTHAAILLFYKKQTYLLDTGFGGNLPLLPVPLTGETVTSANGEFRVEKETGPYGDYVLKMKLKHKHSGWKTGYAFDSKDQINIAALNEMQEVIVSHPASPFNKKPLVTRLTDRGGITLTDTSLTERIDGAVSKKSITEKTFKQAVKDYFYFDV